MWSDILLWLWFPFPWWLLIWGTFLHTCWPFLWPLWKNIYAGCLPILKSDYFFPLRCITSLLILNINLSSDVWFIFVVYRYYLLLHRLPFHVVDYFSVQKLFNLIAPLINFCLFSLCFCVISKNPCCNQFLGTFTLGFLLGVLCFQALNLSSYSISG